MRKLSTREIISDGLTGKLNMNSQWEYVEPKVYYLKLDIGLEFGEPHFLNYNTINNSLNMGNPHSSANFQTTFRDDEIEELDIPLEYFEKVEFKVEV